jgi:plastocyanin
LTQIQSILQRKTKMNKQPSSTIMTRLCRGVFFLALLFLAFQVMPRVLGQRDAATKASYGVPTSLVGASQATPRGVLTSNLTTIVTVGDGGFFFFPSSVMIQAGDTVEWTWSSSGHSTTSGTPGQPSGFWDSGILSSGATFSYTFPNAGSFPYFCSAHGLCCGMIGSVTVSAPTPTPTPTPCGSKIYNIAGASDSALTNTTRIYDIATNTWATGAPIPEPNGLTSHATAYFNGKIYVAGGYDGFALVNTVRAYDIATDTWSTLASLPQAVVVPGFGIINGKLYIAGGGDNFGQLNTLYVYDIATNMWTTGPNVPTGVDGPGSAVYQDKLYLFGGGVFLGGIPFPVTATQIFDPITNSWSTGPSLKVGRLWFYGAAIDDSSIVAPGGVDVSLLSTNDNEQLTATWAIKAPLPYSAEGPFAVSDGTFVYIGGGLDDFVGVHTDTLRYDPVANTYTPLAPAPDAHYLSQAVIVNISCGGGLVLESSFSRKTGRSGSFDVPLPGVEDRSDGKRFVIGFTFNNEVTGADSASTSCGTGGSVSVDPADSHTLLATFNGQTCNQQEVTITLTNVHDDQGNTLASAETSGCFLIGDVNGDGRVGNGDIGNIQGHLGEGTDSANFRDDINADGRINNQDVQAARAHRRESCP